MLCAGSAFTIPGKCTRSQSKCEELKQVDVSFVVFKWICIARRKSLSPILRLRPNHGAVAEKFYNAGSESEASKRCHYCPIALISRYWQSTNTNVRFFLNRRLSMSCTLPKMARKYNNNTLLVDQKELLILVHSSYDMSEFDQYNSTQTDSFTRENLLARKSIGTYFLSPGDWPRRSRMEHAFSKMHA